MYVLTPTKILRLYSPTMQLIRTPKFLTTSSFNNYLKITHQKCSYYIPLIFRVFVLEYSGIGGFAANFNNIFSCISWYITIYSELLRILREIAWHLSLFWKILAIVRDKTNEFDATKRFLYIWRTMFWRWFDIFIQN